MTTEVVTSSSKKRKAATDDMTENGADNKVSPAKKNKKSDLETIGALLAREEVGTALVARHKHIHVAFEPGAEEKGPITVSVDADVPPSALSLLPEPGTADEFMAVLHRGALAMQLKSRLARLWHPVKAQTEYPEDLAVPDAFLEQILPDAKKRELVAPQLRTIGQLVDTLDAPAVCGLLQKFAAVSLPPSQA